MKESFKADPNGELVKVNRERLVVLTGGRALLMQMAHPKVAEGAMTTGYLEREPFKRLLETADAGLKLILKPDEVSEIAHRINRAHSYVHGNLSEDVGLHKKGDSFSATDQDLLKWVGTTIVSASVVGYEALVGELTEEQKDRYVREAADLFEELNVDRGNFPNNWTELQAYIDEMIETEEVKVGSAGRHLAPYIKLQHKEPTRSLTRPINWLTIGLLPDKLRQQYGFKWSNLDQKIFDQVTKGIRKAVPLFGPNVRFSVYYREAN